MTIEIAADIAELLYSRDFINVPELGRFTGNYKPATIDHVQGILHPPSKSIRFDPAYKEDDGFLTRFLEKKYNCTLSEAEELVSYFVKDAKKLMQKREMLLIPNVGRLYLDYENNYQFLQEASNFNIDAFGLPGVHFYPVLRTREQLGYQVKPFTPQKKVPFLQKIADIPAFFQTAAPFLIASVAVLFAVSLYFSKTNNEVTSFDAQPVSLEEVHVNKSPLGAKPAPEELIIEDDPEEDIAYDENYITPEVMDVEEDNTGSFDDPDTDAITLSDDVKDCIIIIGQFGNKKGVRKRVEEIYELGYDAYTDKNKNLTRVGVQFPYESSAEIRKVLRLVRKRFDESAFILKD